MGSPKIHRPVKLIIGLISNREELFFRTEKILEARFKDVDYKSPILDFNHTKYYEAELGENLKRQFLSFRKPISPENIHQVKLFTNKLEKKLSLKGRRQINMDPGYLDLGKLVLLTTKDYSHRLYLARGIYAEVTLAFEDNTFKPHEWTYPDYKTQKYIQVFNKIREIYLKQIRMAI